MRRFRITLPSRKTRYIVYAVGIPVLLIFNIWAANNAFRENRVRVPYSPFFLQQIRDGNVGSITSIGTADTGSSEGARAGDADRAFSAQVLDRDPVVR